MRGGKLKRWAAIVLVILVTSGCAGMNLPIATTPTKAQVDESPRGGAVIESRPMENLDPRILAMNPEAVHVLYRSKSAIDGSPTEVSGSVFVPAGKPPHGGWPIVAVAHVTSGINFECAPSLSPNLFGMAGLVAAWLDFGYAVAVSDYQGLGAPGVHPYLDAQTAGYNVIDSVRALREVSDAVSKRWAAYGGSQGGGAAWAANELADLYAPELTLLGSVSTVPIPDPSDLAQQAADRALTFDQTSAYVWVLISLQRLFPDFPIDEYRHGLATEHWAALSACQGPDAYTRAEVLNQLTPDDLAPSTPEATERIVRILAKMAVPQRRTSAPILVIYGGADTYVAPQWTRRAIAESCAMGSKLGAIEEPGKGHLDVDGGAFMGWLTARFDGLPAPQNCDAQQPR